MKLNRFFVLTWTFFMVLSVQISAQDRVFAYAYQSGVLAGGIKELEVWNSFRLNRVNFFRQIKNRIEFELGLGRGLQTAFYLNISSRASAVNGSVVAYAPEVSFSNEWKYKVSDAAADPLGFALYGEYLIAPNETELEVKIIFDKVLNNAIHAFNIVGEAGWEEDESVVYELNFVYGFSYELTGGFRAGFELYNINKFASASNSNATAIQSAALFGGPAFSFAADGYWVNFSFLPQLTGVYSRSSRFTRGLLLDNYEKLRARLLFSLALGR